MSDLDERQRFDQGQNNESQAQSNTNQNQFLCRSQLTEMGINQQKDTSQEQDLCKFRTK